jgi:hypothetical protein
MRFQNIYLGLCSSGVKGKLLPKRFAAPLGKSHVKKQCKANCVNRHNVAQ